MLSNRNKCAWVAGLLLLVLCLGGFAKAHAQAKREVSYDSLPSQVSAVFQYTANNYYLKNPDGTLSNTNLTGGVVEYAYRRFYPIEVVARVSYAHGQTLSQTLTSYTAGVGYTRGFGRYQPYARITTGLSRTTSTGDQYLYSTAVNGFTAVGVAGLDLRIHGHFGLRAVELGTAYLPYGSKSSIYRSIGTGLFYSF